QRAHAAAGSAGGGADGADAGFSEDVVRLRSGVAMPRIGLGARPGRPGAAAPWRTKRRASHWFGGSARAPWRLGARGREPRTGLAAPVFINVGACARKTSCTGGR